MKTPWNIALPTPPFPAPSLLPSAPAQVCGWETTPLAFWCFLPPGLNPSCPTCRCTGSPSQPDCMAAHITLPPPPLRTRWFLPTTPWAGHGRHTCAPLPFSHPHPGSLAPPYLAAPPCPVVAGICGRFPTPPCPGCQVAVSGGLWTPAVAAAYRHPAPLRPVGRWLAWTRQFGRLVPLKDMGWTACPAGRLLLVARCGLSERSFEPSEFPHSRMDICVR